MMKPDIDSMVKFLIGQQRWFEDKEKNRLKSESMARQGRKEMDAVFDAAEHAVDQDPEKKAKLRELLAEMGGLVPEPTDFDPCKSDREHLQDAAGMLRQFADQFDQVAESL